MIMAVASLNYFQQNVHLDIDIGLIWIHDKQNMTLNFT
jgi:hypothetical protein